MDTFYGIALSLLFLFAIFDLIIGVGNDAVNFLNSAIGSKVASRNTIMIFASLGILLGALFSNGMMEIARKGIFNPSHFYFSDLFFIFLSVMIADIILLDIFNTFGLPTSTTVSIVFSLLGASFSIAVIKIFSPDSKETLSYIGNYINANRTLSMISGIFLSIIISFIFGTIIHYIIRCIFSFDYEKKLKNLGVLWGGISLTSMTYFLIVEGFYNPCNDIIKNNIFSLLFNNFFCLGSYSVLFLIFLLFSFWLIFSFLLTVFKFNIFKFIVLYGTFALAMAFSGNDLVNFIGVPVAGFQSYLIWTDFSSPDPNKLYMENLADNVQISPLVLISAGIIMILTIWFSKKVRTVSDTEINLVRQNEGNEKFNSNFLSRYIVKLFLFFGKKFFKMFPKRFLVKIEKNFKQKNNNINVASFDLLRASANLTISSILISIATAKKLPLSTTFVTFMVSMGTSLADRAWDRESAVYRVSGVLKVIMGWFLTGFIAFIMASFFAIFLFFLKIWAIIILFFIVLFVIYKNYKRHKIVESKKNINIDLEKTNINDDLKYILELLTLILKSIENMYKYCIYSLSKESIKIAKKNRQNYLEIQEKFETFQKILILIIRKNKKDNHNIIKGKIYIKIYYNIKEIIESINIITKYSLYHIINSHNPLYSKQLKKLYKLVNIILEYLKLINNYIVEDNIYNTTNISKIENFIKEIDKHIDQQIDDQIVGITYKKYGSKNSILVFNILLKSRNIIYNLKKIFNMLYNIK